LLPGPFGQDGGVEPAEAGMRLGRYVSYRVQQWLPAFVVVNEDESFTSFNERQDTEFMVHGLPHPNGESKGRLPTAIGLPRGNPVALSAILGVGVQRSLARIRSSRSSAIDGGRAIPSFVLADKMRRVDGKLLVLGRHVSLDHSERIDQVPATMSISTRKVASSLSPGRIARLCRFVQLVGKGPKTRAALVKKLKVNIRGFYRDFQQMREFGVAVEMHDGRYVLRQTVGEALGRLPFPDPGLSVQEVMQLAVGRTAAHQKLRAQIERLLRVP
jgi:hypothetical protein